MQLVSIVVGCGLYICLFGMRVGATTCNVWLISFTLATLQDLLLFAPLKILFMNVYLPGLISKRLKSINDPSDAENFQFSAFMPENAAIYVAMKHPELDASNLVLARGKKAKEEVEKDFDERYQEAMSPGAMRAGGMRNWKMTTGLAVTKVKALRIYTTKGLSKFGLFFFAGFVLLPEFVQGESVRAAERRANRHVFATCMGSGTASACSTPAINVNAIFNAVNVNFHASPCARCSLDLGRHRPHCNRKLRVRQLPALQAQRVVPFYTRLGRHLYHRSSCLVCEEQTAQV